MRVESDITAEDFCAWVRYAAVYEEPYQRARRRARRAAWRAIAIGAPVVGTVMGAVWSGPPIERVLTGVGICALWGLGMGAFVGAASIITRLRGGYAEACVRRIRSLMKHGVVRPTLGHQIVELTPAGIVVATAEGTSEVRWSAIGRVVGTATHAFLVKADGTAVIVQNPRDEQAADRFVLEAEGLRARAAGR